MQPPPPTGPDRSPPPSAPASRPGALPGDDHGRAGRAAIALFVLVTTSGALGSAFSPYLLVEHPLLLIALSPDVRHLMLVAGDTTFLPVLGVGEIRRVIGLLSMYGLGAVYGPSALRWMEARQPRTGRLIRFLERLFERCGALLLVLWPSYTGGLLAGAAGYRFARFLPAMLLGQVVYISSSYYLGESLSEWTEPFIGFLGENLLVSTAVCASAVGLHQIWTRWRDRRGPTR